MSYHTKPGGIEEVVLKGFDTYGTVGFVRIGGFNGDCVSQKAERQTSAPATLLHPMDDMGREV